MARSPSLIARSAQSTPLSTSPHSKKGEDVAHLAVVPLWAPSAASIPQSPPHFRENPAFARLNSCVCNVRRLKPFLLLTRGFVVRIPPREPNINTEARAN